MPALDRAWFNSLVDDSGSGLDGTVWNKHQIDLFMDTIDAAFAAMAEDPPSNHASRHAVGGADPVDVTTLGGYPGGSALFLRADHTFAAVPPTSGGTPAAHAASHAAAGGDPVNVTALAGFPGGSTNFLRADGVFAAPPTGGGGSGSGDVVGPSSAVDWNLAAFDGTTGKVIRDATISAPQVARRDGANTFSYDQTISGGKLTIQNDANPSVDFNASGNVPGTRRSRIVQDLEGGISVQTVNDAGTSPLFEMAHFLRAGGFDVAGAITSAGKPVLAVTGGFPGGTTTFLRADGTWAAPAGGGGGSAKAFQVFTPQQNQPPAANYATLNLRNAHPILEFPAGATDTEAIFGNVLSPGYAGAGLTVDVYVVFATATSGTSRWQVAFERMPDAGASIDTDSFAAFVAGSAVAPATVGVIVKCAIAFTNAEIDGLLAGEAFRVKVRRDADGTTGADGATGVAQVLRVVVRET